MCSIHVVTKIKRKSHDEYPISRPITITGSIDSQYADAQYEPTPVCWGAICAGADWSLVALTNSNFDITEKKTSKLRTALECISPRAIPIVN